MDVGEFVTGLLLLNQGFLTEDQMGADDIVSSQLRDRVLLVGGAVGQLFAFQQRMASLSPALACQDPPSLIP